MKNLSCFAIAVTMACALATDLKAQEAGQPAVQEAPKAVADTHVTRIRDLIGLEVLNQEGESYGVIYDMLVNRQSGQIEFVLVETEKDGEALYPLPWATVTIYRGETDEDRYVILGMPREQFLKAPTVTRQVWPTMTATQWNTYVPQVTAYYGPVRRVEAPRAVRRAVRAVRRAVD